MEVAHGIQHGGFELQTLITRALTLGADASYRARTWLSVDNRDVLSQGSYMVAGAS